mmetsp:Transcript_103305/g.321329  ORF Transcript_103305/g.321329 Transcript_103305/m.321329 type:complete len:253 (-) Transcript_103305:8-766(-)
MCALASKPARQSSRDDRRLQLISPSWLRHCKSWTLHERGHACAPLRASQSPRTIGTSASLTHWLVVDHLPHRHGRLRLDHLPRRHGRLRLHDMPHGHGRAHRHAQDRRGAADGHGHAGAAGAEALVVRGGLPGRELRAAELAGVDGAGAPFDRPPAVLLQHEAEDQELQQAHDEEQPADEPHGAGDALQDHRRGQDRAGGEAAERQQEVLPRDGPAHEQHRRGPRPPAGGSVAFLPPAAPRPRAEAARAEGA